MDSSENVRRGRHSDYGVTGYAEHLGGAVGEGLMFGATGLGLAEGAARKMGMKDGIVKPLGKKFYKWMGGSFSEEANPGNPTNNSQNGSSYSNSGHTTNGPQGQQNQSVHDEPPLNSNSVHNSTKFREKVKWFGGKLLKG